MKTKLLIISIYLLVFTENLFAQADAYTDGDMTLKDQYYYMIRGPFGSFAIILMGLGGLATVFITREGKSAKQTPIMGIVMLLIAAYVFVMRILIISGAMGHEYMEW